jgi:hypothetical protein
MHAPLRSLLAFVLAAGVTGATAATALACSCAVQSENEAFASADVVLIGVVVATHDRAFGLPVVSSGDPIRYTVRVEEVLKGQVGEQVEVLSARDGASCGLELGEGQRWRLFAHRDGELHVGLCSHSELLDAEVPPPSGAPVTAEGTGWHLLLPALLPSIFVAIVVGALRLLGRV